MGCFCRAYFALLSLLDCVSAYVSHTAKKKKKKQDSKKIKGSKYILFIGLIRKNNWCVNSGMIKKDIDLIILAEEPCFY